MNSAELSLKMAVDHTIERLEKILGSIDDETKLILYGYFKQFTVGDHFPKKISIFDVKGRRMSQAWLRNKGMSKREAMARYIQLGNSLL